MTKYWMALLMLLGLTFAGLTARAEEGDDEEDKPVAMEKVPAKAREALKKLAGSAKIESINIEELEDEEEDGEEEDGEGKGDEGKEDKEKEDDGEDDDEDDEIKFYEASWTVDGVEHEATVTADGELVESEESVDVKAVPKAVAAAGKKLVQEGRAKFVKKTVVVYEVETMVEGKEREWLVLPTGQVIEVEMEDDEDDEDDGDGEKEEHGDDNDDKSEKRRDGDRD